MRVLAEEFALSSAQYFGVRMEQPHKPGSAGLPVAHQKKLLRVSIERTPRERCAFRLRPRPWDLLWPSKDLLGLLLRVGEPWGWYATARNARFQVQEHLDVAYRFKEHLTS